MDLTLVAAGAAIGLAMASPPGPVNIIVIRSTLRSGRIGGLAAGAGSLLADTTFATVAAFGIRSIEHFFVAYAMFVYLIGGTLLVFIGVRTARARFSPADLGGETVTPSAAYLWRNAATTFSANIANPGALFGAFAIFGSMSTILKLDSAPNRPAMAVAGFALGATLWWLFLTFIVNRMKQHVSTKILDRISRWTGILIAAFGFVLLSRIWI